MTSHDLSEVIFHDGPYPPMPSLGFPWLPMASHGLWSPAAMVRQGRFANAGSIGAATENTLAERARVAAAAKAAAEQEAERRRVVEAAAKAEAERVAAEERAAAEEFARLQAAEEDAARRVVEEAEAILAAMAEAIYAEAEAEVVAQLAAEVAVEAAAEEVLAAAARAAARLQIEAQMVLEAEVADAEVAAELARRSRELTLIFSDIRAHSVPAADKAKTSDPFATFTLLNGRSGLVETGRTQPVYNNLDPKWPHLVKLFLAAGTEAAMEQAPRVLVRVYDKDLTDADDLLGECEVALSEAKGSHKEVAVHGVGDFGDFAISFKHELATRVSPAATLTLSAIRATGMPKPPKGKKSTAMHDAYLRFHLLEMPAHGTPGHGGDAAASASASASATAAEPTFAATPTMPNTTKPDWGSLELSLPLPRGSARPPLLALGLWDDDVHSDDEALAFQDVRLAEGKGAAEHSVKMIGRKGSGCKEVVVSFVAKIVPVKK